MGPQNRSGRRGENASPRPTSPYPVAMIMIGGGSGSGSGSTYFQTTYNEVETVRV
jgi:hypothetical protein